MVKESSIPFDIPRKLTEEELQETVKYCRHDVEQTVEVFMQRKADFDAIMSLIKMFPEVLSIRDIGLTKAQISAKILECEKVRRNDEFDLFVLPCIQIKKYRKAIDFYMSMVGKTNQKEVYSESLNMIIAGLEHNISWDGYRLALLGGSWDSGSYAGGFYWTLHIGVGLRVRSVGGRLVYVPTVTV